MYPKTSLFFTRLKQTTLFIMVIVGMNHMPVVAGRTNNAYRAYIKKYSEIAVDQMKEYRIPASITLAQGLLESAAGRSDLACKSNNHFGIKCHGWRGRKVYHDDDRKHECFRAYRHVRESYEDHSKFLRTHGRYAFLFRYRITDYKRWAEGLKEAGYATSRSYANQLISIIEDYKSYKYDSKVGKTLVEIDQTHYSHVIALANDLAYLVAHDGDTWKSLAKETGIGASSLIRYNELDKEYVLNEGDVVYLHRKKCKAARGCEIHYVKPGESMHLIAQKYGVQMKFLYKRNRLPNDYMPRVGDQLKLR